MSPFTSATTAMPRSIEGPGGFPFTRFLKIKLFDRLGLPALPFYPLFFEGSPTKIDCRRKGTLILTSLLEDLVGFSLLTSKFNSSD